MKILSVVLFFLSQINPLAKNEKNLILTTIFHGCQGINQSILDQFEITSENQLRRIRIRNTNSFLKSFYKAIKLGLTELMVQE